VFFELEDCHLFADPFMRQRLPTLCATALRWLLAGLFLWAGSVKLIDPKSFARTIDAFGLVPGVLLAPAALLLPLLEILTGLAVLRRWRGGLPAMAGLLLLFMVILGYAIGQNLDVDCGCFSVAELKTHTSLKTAFLRDLIMLAGVAGLGLVKPGDHPPISGKRG